MVLMIQHFDASNTGTYLNAEGFNKAIEDPNTIVVDVKSLRK